LNDIEKLKRQAIDIRKIILSLANLIDEIELPIKLKVVPIEGHKNLTNVFEEMGGHILNKD
jgi:hypothetical protein